MTYTHRFSKRVESYIRSRPGYPEDVLRTLVQECGLTPSWPVADIGSGTGLRAELFLKHGNPVLGVEPNKEMREASEKLLAGYPHFRAVDGSAEETRLSAGSARLVAVGQAFHWFDAAKAGPEFRRILQRGGCAAIVFNTRKVEGNPFGQAFDDLVRAYDTAARYNDLRHENLTHADFERFMGAPSAGPAQIAWCSHKDFRNVQRFNLEGMKERLASMSWVPLPEDPRYGRMMGALEEVFAKHERGGEVEFEYVTELHYGVMS